LDLSDADVGDDETDVAVDVADLDEDDTVDD
jgi:hypothetical protein